MAEETATVQTTRPKRAKSRKTPESTAGLITRIPITEVWPVLENGQWAAKAVENEAFPVRATVFREGHDLFAAEAVLTTARGKELSRTRMSDIAPGLDRYEGWLLAPAESGDYLFHVESWSDPYATWAKAAKIKIEAGVDVELELEEGARLLERAAAGEAKVAGDGPRERASAKSVKPKAAAKKILLEAAHQLRDHTLAPHERLAAGLSAQVREVFNTYPLRDLVQSSDSYPLRVDRARALRGSWYEIFPRSIGATQDEDGRWISGTLKTAAADLPRIAKMGFDVVYLTPIHPIGAAFRKGKNNSLQAAPGDPGSPYGIGNAQGGHDAIHPDLGTFADFDDFVHRARDLGLEVALDLALQCSPDHPWVREHPEWFNVRSDGTIAYAENPPKKYQDIYPLNFDLDPEGIYRAIVEVLELWVRHGVTIFRVDNPHTKPLTFWQRLLAEFKRNHPEVLFLAEAFTRPAMMRTLAQIGFHQSYTYFTWRHTKEEISAYFDEVSNESAHYFRPAFWPTTHDILTNQMAWGGRGAFKARAVLAACGSPTWGIYNGYELVEQVQRPGFEEQIDNEKYEYKPRDYSSPAAKDMAQLLTSLNEARRRNFALQSLRGIKFHATTGEDLLCFSKRVSAQLSPTGEENTVIVVVNLNPYEAREGQVFLDLRALGLSEHAMLCVRDELTGQSYQWGAVNYVRLDPASTPAHVFAVC